MYRRGRFGPEICRPTAHYPHPVRWGPDDPARIILTRRDFGRPRLDPIARPWCCGWIRSGACCPVSFNWTADLPQAVSSTSRCEIEAAPGLLERNVLVFEVDTLAPKARCPSAILPSGRDLAGDPDFRARRPE